MNNNPKARTSPISSLGLDSESVCSATHGGEA